LIKRWAGKKGYCWWSIGGITDKVGRCERSVQYWKRELIDAGRILRIECPGHSDYVIPDPQKFKGDLRQFENGSLIPRQARYDPYSWKPPEPIEQPSLEMQLPEPPKPAEGVQFSAPVIEKMESAEGAASPSLPPADSSIKNPEQEPPKQKNLFISEEVTKGWMLVFSPQDPDLMVRVISHCTGVAIDTLRSAWDSLRQRRRGVYLRDIAVEFIHEIVNGFGGGTLTPRASP